MTTFKYYYDLMSQPSRALYIIFKMSGTPFESCEMSLLKGDHLKKSYESINRFKMVPAILTNDGFKLSESVAILRYVDSDGHISKDLYPIEPKQRARVDEYLEWYHTNTRLSCVKYLRTKVLIPFVSNKMATSEELKELKDNLDISMDLMENIWLTDQKFLAGNQLTAADIFAACEIQSVVFAQYDPFLNRPKLRKWLENVRESSNPHFDEVHKYWQLKKIGISVMAFFLPVIVRVRSFCSKSRAEG